MKCSADWLRPSRPVAFFVVALLKMEALAASIFSGIMFTMVPRALAPGGLLRGTRFTSRLHLLSRLALVGHRRVHSGAQTEALCAGTPPVERDAHGAALSLAVSDRGVLLHAPAKPLPYLLKAPNDEPFERNSYTFAR
ncbi:hypothetical protein GEV33_001587 [Tenebrio molitor]|uniref:Uncharacterized protein n=1 Tax=Tenebrio molitor TaxID=7067 RepID=A0A8J6HUQ9_TENMO|nr:hypothetical protein GEV33_001587 [Tenebrio molitor]